MVQKNLIYKCRISKEENLFVIYELSSVSDSYHPIKIVAFGLAYNIDDKNKFSGDLYANSLTYGINTDDAIFTESYFTFCTKIYSNEFENIKKHKSQTLHTDLMTYFLQMILKRQYVEND